MTQTYSVSGMTCSGCQYKVQHLLSKAEGVTNVSVDLDKSMAIIEMEKPMSLTAFKNALKDYPKYQLDETIKKQPISLDPIKKEPSSSIKTYAPIVLIFAYLIAITLWIEIADHRFVWMRWMNHFMAGFFLVFSFFKLLDLKGFVESYSTYDIIAKKWGGWGYLYAFIELGLGLAYLSGINPLVTNSVTFLVMTFSIIGVIQSILHKRKIQCACLGAVFKLPMSTITIIEDALMIGMSGSMLIKMM